MKPEEVQITSIDEFHRQFLPDQYDYQIWVEQNNQQYYIDEYQIGCEFAKKTLESLKGIHEDSNLPE